MKAQVELYSEIIKPEDCTFAIGIPTTKESFSDAIKRADKGYAGMFNNVWKRYEAEITREIRNIKPILENMNVQFIEDLTLNKFKNFFDDNERKVIILFSHWEKNKVEFADGFAGIDRIIDQIPEEAQQIIDLCVCNPVNLRLALKQKRPACTVRFINKQATPYLWLKFYKMLFRHLERESLTYTKAIEEVAIQLLKTT